MPPGVAFEMLPQGVFSLRISISEGEGELPVPPEFWSAIEVASHDGAIDILTRQPDLGTGAGNSMWASSAILTFNRPGPLRLHFADLDGRPIQDRNVEVTSDAVQNLHLEL